MRHDLVTVALIDVVRTEISGNRCRSRPIAKNLRTCILHSQYHFCTGCPTVDNLCQGFTVQMDVFTLSPAPPPLALRREPLRSMRCARVGLVVVRAPVGRVPSGEGHVGDHHQHHDGGDGIDDDAEHDVDDHAGDTADMATEAQRLTKASIATPKRRASPLT